MRGVFDIVGPVMIGPSSSHTAGAVRLGRMARLILGEKPKSAAIYLHGSFALTHKGHGTDKALVAGLLGMATDDEGIRDVFERLVENELTVSFQATDLGEVHPNTVKLVLLGSLGRQTELIGSSVGGGNILITKIAGYDVSLNGKYHTLLTIHDDKPGVVALTSHILAQNGINIAFMRVSRQKRGKQALMLMETDEAIDEKVVLSIRKMNSIQIALAIPPL